MESGEQEQWTGRWPLVDMPAAGQFVVYRLSWRGEVVYIGSTRNFAQRLVSHSTNKEFDHWEAVEYRDLRAMRLEEQHQIDLFWAQHYRSLPLYNKNRTVGGLR